MSTSAVSNAPGTVGSSSSGETLARAQAITTGVSFKKERVTLRTLVTIQTCPQGFRSRLGYHANFYITRPNSVEREIGHITAWRISKPTGANRNINPGYWLDEWCRPNLRLYNDSDKELAYCLRALYGTGINSSPEPSQRINSDEVKNSLRDTGHDLVFIQSIYIKWREDPNDEQTGYSGSGLCPTFLDSFYRLLGSQLLPNWFSFNGPITYLLLPGLPLGAPENDYWKHQQQILGMTGEQLDDHVFDRLTELYQRPRYGYNCYIQSSRVASAGITVFGRTIEPDDCNPRAGDRLLLATDVQASDPPVIHSSPSPLRHQQRPPGNDDEET